MFGVWAPGEDVAKLTYFGLYALQHRGQESAGIAVSNGRQILVYKDMGLVSQVFDESTLSQPGRPHRDRPLPLLHHRREHLEERPADVPATHGGSIALGHNGNLINTHELKQMVEELPKEQDELDLHLRQAEDASTNDTGLVTALLAHHPDTTLEQRALEVLPQLKGAFSFVWMNEDSRVRRPRPAGHPPAGPGPARPRLGGRQRGRRPGHRRRQRRPRGRAGRADRHRRERPALPPVRRAEPKGCVFEYVYLARPDATIAGRNVHEARVAMGRRLAREHPVDADLVMPVPESGTPAAVGFAEESGIPYGQGFVKNAYVGRTFIQPSQTLRQLGIRLKLNALEHMIRGKRVIVVDDSIVRGNTQRAQVRMLREAGALEVHVRISSPPVKWPCFYGIDFATRAELIANGLDVDEIAASVGADSLGYISLEGMIEATGQTERPAVRGLLHRAATRSSCPTSGCSASTCWSRRRTSAALPVLNNP